MLPPPDSGVADRVMRLVRAVAGPAGWSVYRAMLGALDGFCLLRWGRPLTRLSVERRRQLLSSLGRGPLAGPLAMLCFPLRTACCDRPELFAALGVPYERRAAVENARWRQRICSAAELDEDIECDVVVVGTGAGGAVVATGLAERGLAVAMVEEGSYHGRWAFTGRALDAFERLYRPLTHSTAVGRPFIPIPLGRCVGGTTTVNAGTCLRPPDRVLRHWSAELGLTELSPDALAPYFERVEQDLQVAPSQAEVLGGIARVVARGADVLGWSHYPLPRNAPGCDGQGVCTFGCPTGAKQSTDVSYVPRALRAAALLVTELRVERILMESGRAAGVEAVGTTDGRRRRLRCRAVVLACGAIGTPVLLLRQGILGRHPALGKNLTVHPAIAVSGLFDEEIRGFAAVPQGYCVDAFHDRGILMEGASAPPDGAAALFDVIGPELTELVEAFDRIGTFGAMVAERAGAGTVSALRGGRPWIRYRLHRDVRERLREATVLLCRLLEAGGARRLFLPVIGSAPVASSAELRDLPAERMILSAYHPLGTCRMGLDSRSSVVGPDYQVHGIPGLYICDGSIVPGSPEVNPQITIMALASRAADRIADRLL